MEAILPLFPFTILFLFRVLVQLDVVYFSFYFKYFTFEALFLFAGMNIPPQAIVHPPLIPLVGKGAIVSTKGRYVSEAAHHFCFEEFVFLTMSQRRQQNTPRAPKQKKKRKA